MRKIELDERRARLASRHHLAQAASSVGAVVADLIGLHSSDPASVYLACRARLEDFAVDDLEGELYEKRSLVRILAMRRTMFVVPVDLAPVLDAACTQAYRERERQRLIGLIEAQGVARDGKRWLEDVEQRTMQALTERGEATAVELTEDVEELRLKLAFGEGKTWAGTVGLSTRVLFLLATDGRIVRGRPRGSWQSSQYRWVPSARRLGPRFGVEDPAHARDDLLRRWLRSFGPGTEADIRWWTGWTATSTRATLARLGAVETKLEEGTGFVLPDDQESRPDGEPWGALLPALDSTAMGWKERSWYLGNHRAALFDRNGNAGPTVWSNGRVVGGWGQRSNGEVAVRLLEEVDSTAEAIIAMKAASLGRWLDGVSVIPRFRTPLEKELATG